MESLITTGIAVLLFTAFAKILTALSILRYGIGLKGAGFGVVIFAVSLGLSFFVMDPQFQELGGVGKLISGDGTLNASQVENTFSPFMKKHTEPETLERFGSLYSKLHKVEAKEGKQDSFAVITAAFLISELKTAFKVGFAVLIPFLLIDLLIANVLLILGATQVPLMLVSLPLKILLFISVDGWTLVAEKLIGTYMGQL